MSLISGSESKIFAKGEIGMVRKAQEDSHGWKLGTPNGDLFVVCDGMGGHVGGATASRIAVDSIIGYIDQEKYATPVDALDGSLQFANMQILGYATEHPELNGMGTTACIVLMQGDDVWIAHVGDSRIYLYLGNERQLHRITKDHSYVQTLVDAGEITDDEAEHHANKNRIMRALGIKPELHPTFNYENRPIHPKNGDVFLICSDGLSGMIPDSTIGRTMGESMDLQQKGERLIELAMIGETVQPGGQDNCTLEMIEVDNSPWTKSEFKSYNPKTVVHPAQKNYIQEPPKPEPPKPIKRQPKLNGLTLRFVAIAVVTIILATILAVFLPPMIHNYNLGKAKTELKRLKKDAEAKESDKGIAEGNVKEAEQKLKKYTEKNTDAYRTAEKLLNLQIDNYNKAKKDYCKAVQDYNNAVKKYNKRYVKNTTDKKTSEANIDDPEDWEDNE